MTSQSEAFNVEPIPITTGRRPRWFVNIDRRIGVLLAAVTMLLFMAVGSWVYWVSTPAVREIPETNLDGADPEIANAVDAARQAVVRSPRSPRAWGHLAMILHGHAFHNAADACYTVAGELDGKNPAWPYLQGFLHQDGAGGPERAMPLFERAAGLSPPNSMARLRLAGMLFELGRLDEANQEYLKVLTADPESAHALLGLGLVAAAREKYVDSLRFLQPIAENALVQKRACGLLANVHERLGDRAAAERDRHRLAELPEDEPRPDDAMNQVGQLQVGINIRLRKAALLRRQNRLSELISTLNEAVERYPNSDAAWAELGLAMLGNDDSVRAEQALKKCVSLAPKSAEYRLHLGMLQLSRNQYQSAAESLRKSIELRPTSGPAHFALGECLRGLGDSTEANVEYRAALRYAPDHELARQRLESLSGGPESSNN